MRTTQFIRALPSAAFHYRTLEAEVNSILQEDGVRVVAIHTVQIDTVNGPLHEIVIVFERQEPDGQ